MSVDDTCLTKKVCEHEKAKEIMSPNSGNMSVFMEGVEVQFRERNLEHLACLGERQNGN